jgi:hypothetical protein
MPEHADLIVAGENDPAVAILKLAEFTDELLGHAAPSLLRFLQRRCCADRSSWTPGRSFKAA